MKVLSANDEAGPSPRTREDMNAMLRDSWIMLESVSRDGVGFTCRTIVSDESSHREQRFVATIVERRFCRKQIADWSMGVRADGLATSERQDGLVVCVGA
jgi:hypothetical protein